MLNPETIAEVFKYYLEFGGNISAVVRQLKGKVSDRSIRRLEVESNGEWQKAAADYRIKLAQAQAELTDANLQIAARLNTLLEKIDEAVQDEVDIKALAQGAYALQTLSKEISRITAQKTDETTWEELKDNAIIDWCLSQPEIKPLIIKHKKHLLKYVNHRIRRKN
jgi:hypothetical protein